MERDGTGWKGWTKDGKILQAWIIAKYRISNSITSFKAEYFTFCGSDGRLQAYFPSHVVKLRS